MAEQNSLVTIRECSICGTNKPLTEFSKQANCVGGYRKECKDCRNAKARDWYLANKDYRKQTAQAWRNFNQDKIARASAAWTKANSAKRSSHYHARKARLKQNGVFEIGQKELRRIYSSACFYCGSKENISQDHVIPINRGGRHSIGNLVAACGKCNSSKQDKTITEWKLHLKKTLIRNGAG